MTTTKKKKTFRELGLQKHATYKRARDFMDFDYVAKLSPEEHEWLARFSAEYYQNFFANDGKDFTEHGSDERREYFGRNNARGRDMWNVFYRACDPNLETGLEARADGNRTVPSLPVNEKKKLTGEDGE